MMLYRNTKVKVHSSDRDTHYFNMVAGVLHGHTLAPHLFIIYVLRTSMDKMKDNGFKMTKEKSRSYPAQTITDVDYADDKALLANTPAQAKSLLHSQERPAAGIGLHINTDKTEYMCYNQRGVISTLNSYHHHVTLSGRIHLTGSSVSSTKTYINMRLSKAWTAIDRLSVICKSDLTDKIKRMFFQAAVVSILLYGCTT